MYLLFFVKNYIMASKAFIVFFEDLQPNIKEFILNSYLGLLELPSTKLETLKKIFSIGKPSIVIEVKEDKTQVFRLHKNSFRIIGKLIKTYI